jgi:hypothetical protein
VIKEMLDYFDVNDPAEVMKAKQRFQDEAATLTILAHPGIPKIYDFFSDGEHNYIVMEYVEGQDLRRGITHIDEHSGKAVPGQPYPPEDIVRYGIQVCKVLEYLAQIKPNPVVHHDIKPANLVLDKNAGEVRLVDFGTARARLLAQAGGRMGVQKTSIYGTAGYAAPEQYQGQSSPQSDVYALAATMYHLLTDDDPGDHPFQFPQTAQFDPSLDRALRQALEQNPQGRSSAAQLRQDLEKRLRRGPGTRPQADASCVLLPTVPEGDIATTVQALVRVLKISEQQATIWAYAGPQVVYKTKRHAEASQVLTQLRAAGVNCQIVSIDESKSLALPAQTRNALTTRGEVPGLQLTALGSDKHCHCYLCGHEWTSTKAAGDSPSSKCPKCQMPGWSLHRLFKCRVCGHEFAGHNQTSPAKQVFPACPKCGASAWLPGDTPVLRLKGQLIDVGTVIVGQSPSFTLDLHNAGGGTLRGVVRCRESWWSYEQRFTGAGKVTLSLDTQSLAGEQNYRGMIDIVSNGGAAEAQIELCTQTPQKVAISSVVLDFGSVGAQPPPSQTVQITNKGGGMLQGTVAADAQWIQVSSAAINGNSLDLSVSIKPDDMPPGQASVGRIALATNGGDVHILVQANALPAAITLSTASMDFGAVPLRETRSLAIRATNTGAGRLHVQIDSTPDWVRVEGTRWSGNLLDLAVEVDGRTLADGIERTGVIHLTSNGGDVDMAVRAVALGPTLAVEPLSLDLCGVSSGSRVKRRLRCTNLGIGTLTGATRCSASWLRVTQEWSSRSAANIDVLIATRGLAPGDYTTEVTIDSNGGSAQVGVRIQVVPFNLLAQIPGWGTLVVGLLGFLVLMIALSWQDARPPEPSPVVTVAPTASIMPTVTPKPLGPGVPPAETATRIAVTVAPTPTPLATVQSTRMPPGGPVPTITPTPTSPPQPVATPVVLCPDPRLRITSPSDGATVRGVVQVRGRANIDRFSYFKFEFRPEGTPTWSFLMRSDQPVAEGLLWAWDTKAVSAGAYRLRLVVVDQTGNYPEPCEIRVVVAR